MVFSAPEILTVSKPKRKPAKAAVRDQMKIRTVMVSLLNQDAGAKIFRLRNSLRNFPFGSYWVHRSTKSDSFSYLARSVAGLMVNSFPQCGRALNGASSLSMIGSRFWTADQSGFQVK